MFTFKHSEIVPEISQKLADNHRPFPNLCSVELKEIQEPFDLKVFGDSLKKNPYVSSCYLKFYGSNEFYSQITRDENELSQALPSTCNPQMFLLPFP